MRALTGQTGLSDRAGEVLMLDMARRLDLWLGTTLGRPYHALLGLGIVLEIVQHIREFAEKSFGGLGVAKTVLAIILFLALFVHQVGELSEHSERRRHR
jgi:hypothetical protein